MTPAKNTAQSMCASDPAPVRVRWRTFHVGPALGRACSSSLAAPACRLLPLHRSRSVPSGWAGSLQGL